MADLTGARVLLVGGAGFIGSHIIDQLLAEPVREIVVLDNFARGSRHNLQAAFADERVTLVEGSVTDVSLVERLMEGTDLVWLLAALWLFECVHEPRSAIEVNCVGTFNVVDAAYRAGVEKVVYSSSASVYGDASFTPMTEDHPFNNNTLYGATKIAGEQFFRAYHEQHGLDYVGLRYMNVYGPRMDYKGAYVSVIMKVLDKIDAGEQPIIFGDGSQAYDFVHVTDVARANILAMKSDATDVSLNVATGIETSINELVGALLEETGADIEPMYLANEQMFVTHRVGATEMAEELIGFRAALSYREGLRSVIEWRRVDQARSVQQPAA